MPKHIHADLIEQYAQDAKETDTPWDRWQYFSIILQNWFDETAHVCFLKEIRYRKKPKIININGFKVPEPLKIVPDKSTPVYVVDLFGISRSYIKNSDKAEWIQLGILHSTKEDAELHRKALLSFTTQEE